MSEKQDLEKELPLSAKLEAILFVASEPVPMQQLASALGINIPAVEKGLKDLDEVLMQRGIILQRHGGHVQLTTTPHLGELVEHFLGLEATTQLSRAALETLAIVAYKQPVTRPQIDSIRGVNSDSMIKGLLNKGLILESGRADGPGRPILYSTTPEFLQHFGLRSILELPAFMVEDENEPQESLLKE